MPETREAEDAMRALLKGASLDNALSFAAFLRANGFTPKGHDSGDGWSVLRGEESCAFVLVNGAAEMPGPWTIWFNFCDFGDGEGVKEKVKETAWAHANQCAHFASGGRHCGCGDQPGRREVIFGKAFENRCHSPLDFTDPDAATLEDIQVLFLLLAENHQPRKRD